MTARISDIVPLLFITLLCVGLVEGGYLLFEHFILVPAERAEVGEAETPTIGSATKAEGEKQVDYRVILQRNLFGTPPPSDSDKAEASAVPVPVSTEAVTATNLDFVLMGTIKGSAGTERAVILDKKLQKQELYEKGDVIQGAFVKEIARGKVILSYNGRDEILDMSEAATVRQPVIAQPPGINAPMATGQSRTPLRVVPRRPAAIAPGTIPNASPNTTQPVNVDRVRRTLVPQRIYQPAQPPNKQ
jgi:general secretion pathway protein C